MTLTAAGFALIGVALASEDQPPPAPSAAPAAEGLADQRSRQLAREERREAQSKRERRQARRAAARRRERQPHAPRSRPMTIGISSLGVESELLRTGRNTDGTLEVPESFSQASWYNDSVTPGERGPTVILGHVDSLDGPGVFYELGRLRKGDRVAVGREDGSRAVFEIEDVGSYSKSEFPHGRVYGNSNKARIRLITCGGDYDDQQLSYDGNVIAFGTLVRVIDA